MLKKIAVFDTPVEWGTEPTKVELDLIDKIYMGMAKATMRRICNLYADSCHLDGATIEDFSFEQTESMFAKDLYSQNWVILPKVEVFCDEKIFEKNVKNG